MRGGYSPGNDELGIPTVCDGGVEIFEDGGEEERKIAQEGDMADPHQIVQVWDGRLHSILRGLD